MFLCKVDIEQGRAGTWVLGGPSHHQPLSDQAHALRINNLEFFLMEAAFAFYTFKNKIIFSLKLPTLT